MKDRDIAISEALEGIRPTIDEFVGRRINNRGFAKLILFLGAISKHNEYTSVREVKEYMSYSQQSANSILNAMASAGFFKKVYLTSNIVEYHFKVNKETNQYYVLDYTEKARKLLKVRVRVILEEVNEDDS